MGNRPTSRGAQTNDLRLRKRSDLNSAAIDGNALKLDNLDAQKTSNQTLNPSKAVTAKTAVKERRQKIKCPSCKSILVTPNDTVFSCPCGQMLVKPEEELGTPSTVKKLESMRVRCPRCLVFCDMPAGAILVPCACGLHLKHPGSLEANGSVDGKDPLGESNASRPAGKFSVWQRRIITSEKLGWRRIWGETELFQVIEAENLVLGRLKEAADTLADEEIRVRLVKCMIDASGVSNREQLLHLVHTGPAELSRKFTGGILRRLLDDRLLDHSSCLSCTELAKRLFAYEWSGRSTAQQAVTRTRSSAGFVRCFFHDSLPTNKTYLGTQGAAEFLISTRLGTEESADPAKVTSEEILQVSSFPLKEKILWLEERIDQLCVPWDKGHVRVRVRRSHLLEDSFNAFLQLEPEDMHRFFRFEFLDEPGQDAGGVAREWFTLVVEECFDLNLGLFEFGGTGNISYQIAPHNAAVKAKDDESEVMQDDVRLKYFRFLGRVLGKAVLDGHHVAAHLTRVLYKHILAWPITEDDIEYLDDEIAKSTQAIRDCEDVSLLSLDFTMSFTDESGVPQTIELLAGGSKMEVTNANREEYLQLRLKQITLLRVAPFVHEMLIGMYETVPFTFLSVFDFAELELLICGLPGRFPLFVWVDEDD